MSDEKRNQVIALGQLGWTVRRIEETTGVRRETASKYLKQAGVPVRRGRPPGSRQPKPAILVSADSGADSKPAISVSTDSGGPTVVSSSGRSCCEPHREFIEEAVALGRNARAIWQDLVDEHRFKASYASVKRFAVKLRSAPIREPYPWIVTAPGEEGQVDYGDGPMVRDPNTLKYRRTRLFVMTLGFSRKSVRLLVFRSSTRIWAELHETAFRRLAGVPRVIVLDNLKEAVLKADIYDPGINPVYRDLLRHFGAVALPCRVADPNRKGKVESGVGHAQKKLKGLRFESIEEAQSYLDRWETNWADTRIHGTTKRQVSAMFEEERPFLRPLPAEPFRYFHFGERVVHLDGCVEVEGAYYGAPPGHLGETLAVQWDGLVVRLLDRKTGLLLREHWKQRRGGHRVAPEDRSRKTPQTTERLLERAARVGTNVGGVSRAIHRDDGELGVRRILGLLSLVKKHGALAVDASCAAAIDLGVPTYRFVRRHLERHSPVPVSLKQIDPLIRELTHYRALIEQRTEGDPT